QRNKVSIKLCPQPPKVFKQLNQFNYQLLAPNKSKHNFNLLTAIVPRKALFNFSIISQEVILNILKSDCYPSDQTPVSLIPEPFSNLIVLNSTPPPEANPQPISS
ncbi:hypothetical protein NEHOM01_1214, partial [Nematocida homosporus]|uniref:uncharacterized protein n=1 Tax=Nematocida homosporus TaxID=1912981 RepID=UPI00221E894C